MRKPEANQELESTTASTGASSLHLELQQYIEDEHNLLPLMGILQSYVAKAGIVRTEDVTDAARDLLGDVVTEAFRSFGRFDREYAIRPWLLGIAAKQILRRQRKQHRMASREVQIGDRSTGFSEGMSSSAQSDGDLFDRIASMSISRVIVPLESANWARSYVEAELQNEIADRALVKYTLHWQPGKHNRDELTKLVRNIKRCYAQEFIEIGRGDMAPTDFTPERMQNVTGPVSEYLNIQLAGHPQREALQNLAVELLAEEGWR